MPGNEQTKTCTNLKIYFSSSHNLKLASCYLKTVNPLFSLLGRQSSTNLKVPNYANS